MPPKKPTGIPRPVIGPTSGPTSTPQRPQNICAVKPATPTKAAEIVCFNAVVAPVPVAPSVAAPGSGPASGLWAGNTPSDGTAPAPVPPPIPPTPCTAADLFTECFIGATGTLDKNNVGPENGWTWSKSNNGGQVIFTDGQMAQHGDFGVDNPGARKAHTPIATVADITIQSSFTEYPLSGSGMFYEWIVTNTGNTQRVYLGLFGDGFLAIRAGLGGSGKRYTGTWTPNQGSHKVQILVDGTFGLRLFIDDVEIVLNQLSNGSIAGGTLPGDVIDVSSSPDSAPNIDASAVYTGVFIASGNLVPPTTFCCP